MRLVIEKNLRDGEREEVALKVGSNARFYSFKIMCDFASGI